MYITSTNGMAWFLLFLGILFIVAELFIFSFGVLAVAGAGSLVVGLMLLLIGFGKFSILSISLFCIFLIHDDIVRLSLFNIFKNVC